MEYLTGCIREWKTSVPAVPSGTFGMGSEVPYAREKRGNWRARPARVRMRRAAIAAITLVDDFQVTVCGARPPHAHQPAGKNETSWYPVFEPEVA
mmetsp:Transcript_103833/g.180396  ORF Transcript_103833/g.180396 Transcript_103833/m.180396 type:complete len:95 (+) Transcript_103833:315-599(+)